MDWSTYYERFYGWADSTQISRISTINEFGDVSDEVAEIVQNMIDCKACTRLVKRALAYGVRFTASEIDDMISSLDSVPDELLLTCRTAFSEEQIDSISFYYNNADVLETISRRSGVSKNDTIYIKQCNSKIKVKNINVRHVKTPKPTFGQIIGAVGLGIFSGLFGSKYKKHGGRCDGNCANCPPHFGYRHGRWYYGHGHNYGCVFGGNRGGGNS